MQATWSMIFITKESTTPVIIYQCMRPCSGRQFWDPKHQQISTLDGTFNKSCKYKSSQIVVIPLMDAGSKKYWKKQATGTRYAHSTNQTVHLGSTPLSSFSQNYGTTKKLDPLLDGTEFVCSSSGNKEGNGKSSVFFRDPCLMTRVPAVVHTSECRSSSSWQKYSTWWSWRSRSWQKNYTNCVAWWVQCSYGL